MTTRLEVNVQTGEVKEVSLSAQEIAQAEAQYTEWMAGEEQRKQEQITQLEQQLAVLKGTA